MYYVDEIEILRRLLWKYAIWTVIPTVRLERTLKFDWGLIIFTFKWKVPVHTQEYIFRIYLGEAGKWAEKIEQLAQKAILNRREIIKILIREEDE